MKPAQRRASLLGPAQFRFLNETHDLDSYGWDAPALTKLWRYNLHYFDDLNARDSGARLSWQRALMSRWVRENPPGLGSGWEPYPVSLRIVNWIKWTMGGNPMTQECLQSLAVQVRWLAGRMETHLLGNHLFANAKALVFAGLFFEGAEARGWMERGLRTLKREVQEQILSDGGQFELSTMYHALALEDMLDLCNLSTAFADAVPLNWRQTMAGWRKRIGSMRDWLAAMCHPDGEISFFNDAALGIAPSPIELEQYAARLGFSERTNRVQSLIQFADSGYIRIEQGAAVAILDVARVGPDYLPAHAHADTLSFELSLFGQRLFVNTGTSCYGQGDERLRQRGTAAHNTVTINGENSSEVWAGFRVGRRARPVGLRVTRNPAIEVFCAHDGYQHLPGKPEHQRRWLACADRLVVEDRIRGDFTQAQARFHLHPAVTVVAERIDSNECAEVILQLPEGGKIRLICEGGVLRQQASDWHPEFGSSEPTVCLVVNFNDSLLRTQIEWSSMT